jgi:hypothetical protein
MDKGSWSAHLVNHWRVGVGFRKSKERLDAPIMLGDVYVDHDDPGRIRKILHFGLQNLYDPAKDEWIVMDTFSRRRAGQVTLPGACKLPPLPGLPTPASMIGVRVRQGPRIPVPGSGKPCDRQTWMSRNRTGA